MVSTSWSVGDRALFNVPGIGLTRGTVCTVEEAADGTWLEVRYDGPRSNRDLTWRWTWLRATEVTTADD